MRPNWTKASKIMPTPTLDYDYERDGPLMATIPIKIDLKPGTVLPATTSPRRKTTLGDPDKRPMTVERWGSVMKQVWTSQRLMNQFNSSWLDMKHQSPEDQAWEDAIRWIERKYAPPEPEQPVTFDWDWPR